MSDRFKRRLDENVQRPVGRDVDDELRFHLEMRRLELESEGLDESAAKEEAERLFGDRKRIAAQCRRQTRAARRATERGWIMTRLLQDLRFAWRKLTREPGFAAAAIFTLALGIGANTAVFSVLDAVLLRPLPFPESERLMALWEVNEDGIEIAVAGKNFEDWHDQATTFDSMALFNNWNGVTLTGDFDARTANASAVSVEFFRALGIRPAMGRFTSTEDHQLGAEPVAVISETLWRGLFGGRSLEEISLRMGGEAYDVVGVVPAGQEFPETTEVWAAYERIEDASSRTAHNYRVVARLPGDRSQSDALAAARAEMTTIAARLAGEHEGDIDAVNVAVTPWHEELVAGSRQPLWLLLGASGLLLVVACSNLAGSLLARSFSRRREMAVRAAIGAGKGGLMQQLIVESVLLATLGGLAGIVVATAFVRVLLAVAPPSLPRLDDVGLDPRVLVFTFVVSAIAGIVLGLVPGWSLTRTPLRRAMTGDAEGGRQHRLWNTLVATEVALALVLLVGAGLLLGSVRKILQEPMGFDAEGVLTAELELPVDMPEWAGDLTPLLEAEQDLGRFALNFLDEVSSIPGIDRAALTSSLPSRGMPTTTVFLDDRPIEDAAVAGYLMVSEDYFDLLEIPVLQGRTFDSRDVTESEHVAVISQSMAERYWPDSEALGQRIRPPGMDPHGETWLRVVGVVGDVRQRGATRAAPSLMYVSLRQRPFRARWSSLVAKGDTAPETLVGPLRETAQSVSKDMPLEIATLPDVLRTSISRQRFQMLLITTFAGLGLLLAAGGIWAVVAFQVAERTRELGIRIALGAAPEKLVSQVLMRALWVVGAGCVAGLVTSIALSRWIEALLYGIEPNDPAILTATAAGLAVIGVVASLLPALRAARVDPSTSLRSS